MTIGIGGVRTSMMQPEMRRGIARYPAHTDTDDYFRYTEEEVYPTDTEDDNWNQPLNVMEPEWQYEDAMEENMEDAGVTME